MEENSPNAAQHPAAETPPPAGPPGDAAATPGPSKTKRRQHQRGGVRRREAIMRGSNNSDRTNDNNNDGDDQHDEAGDGDAHADDNDDDNDANVTGAEGTLDEATKANARAPAGDQPVTIGSNPAHADGLADDAVEQEMDFQTYVAGAETPTNTAATPSSSSQNKASKRQRDRQDPRQTQTESPSSGSRAATTSDWRARQTRRTSEEADRPGRKGNAAEGASGSTGEKRRRDEDNSRGAGGARRGVAARGDGSRRTEVGNDWKQTAVTTLAHGSVPWMQSTGDSSSPMRSSSSSSASSSLSLSLSSSTPPGTAPSVASTSASSFKVEFRGNRDKQQGGENAVEIKNATHWAAPSPAQLAAEEQKKGDDRKKAPPSQQRGSSAKRGAGDEKKADEGRNDATKTTVKFVNIKKQAAASSPAKAPAKSMEIVGASPSEAPSADKTQDTSTKHHISDSTSLLQVSPPASPAPSVEVVVTSRETVSSTDTVVPSPPAFQQDTPDQPTASQQSPTSAAPVSETIANEATVASVSNENQDAATATEPASSPPSSSLPSSVPSTPNPAASSSAATPMSSKSTSKASTSDKTSKKPGQTQSKGFTREDWEREVDKKAASHESSQAKSNASSKEIADASTAAEDKAKVKLVRAKAGVTQVRKGGPAAGEVVPDSRTSGRSGSPRNDGDVAALKDAKPSRTKAKDSESSSLSSSSSSSTVSKRDLERMQSQKSKLETEITDLKQLLAKKEAELKSLTAALSSASSSSSSSSESALNNKIGSAKKSSSNSASSPGEAASKSKGLSLSSTDPNDNNSARKSDGAEKNETEKSSDNKNDSKGENKEGAGEGQKPKRPLIVYQPYFSNIEVTEGLQNGTVLKGQLRINQHRTSEAYVTIPGRSEDLFIPSKEDINRAFHGEEVAVVITGTKELKKRIDPFAESDDEEDADEEKGNDEEKRNEEDVEGRVDNGAAGDAESKKVSDGLMVHRIRTTARVVYVFNRRRIQLVGNIVKRANRLFFKPADVRYPFCLIHKSSIEPGDEDDEKGLFTFSVDVQWGVNSQRPIGSIKRRIGDVGDLVAETHGILIENGIINEDFTKAVLNCLPPTPWTISPADVAERRDLRSARIFSIDPPTARDLDDALSITEFEDGTFEVGVHIADVSHFVKENSALDDEAMRRATSVYLVDGVIPMLPRLLCEVVWKMTADAQITEEWFGKSIIRSCCKLNYDQVQSMIEGKSWEEACGLAIDGAHSSDQVIRDVLNMQKLAVIMRKRRFENGALSLNRSKLTFQLHRDSNDPKKSPQIVGCGPYVLKDSNRLVEEFMLLANSQVAQKLTSAYPDSSLLRRHVNPRMDKIVELGQWAETIGYNLDVHSSIGLQRSLEAIENEDIRASFMQLLTRPMQRAKYICSNMSDPPMEDNVFQDYHHHYALNCALYTHFTSPIRRYADLVVHRELLNALKNEPCPVESKHLETLTEHLNDMRACSAAAQDGSIKLYYVAYIATMPQPYYETAILVGVKRNHLDVILPTLGFEGRISINPKKNPLFRVRSISHDHVTLFWLKNPKKAEEKGQGREKDKGIERATVPGAEFEEADAAESGSKKESAAAEGRVDLDVAHAHTSNKDAQAEISIDGKAVDQMDQDRVKEEEADGAADERDQDHVEEEADDADGPKETEIDEAKEDDKVEDEEEEKIEELKVQEDKADKITESYSTDGQCIDQSKPAKPSEQAGMEIVIGVMNGDSDQKDEQDHAQKKADRKEEQEDDEDEEDGLGGEGEEDDEEGEEKEEEKEEEDDRRVVLEIRQGKKGRFQKLQKNADGLSQQQQQQQGDVSDSKDAVAAPEEGIEQEIRIFSRLRVILQPHVEWRPPDFFIVLPRPHFSD